MKLSCPRTPPAAFRLKPNPTRKKVNDEVANTSMVLSRITLLCYIFIEPVSFIINPTCDKISVTETKTTHTVSKILFSYSNLLSMIISANCYIFWLFFYYFLNDNIVE